MRENFETAFRFTVGPAIEGGYVNDPKDKGGPTNHGVTQATLSIYLRRHATIEDVKALTLTTAKDLYLRLYWQPTGCDALPAGVDVLLWDCAVNSGVGRAHEFSTKTATLQPVPRIEAIHRLRMSWWQHLSSWVRYKGGWTTRETACRALALKLAGGGHA